MASSCVYMSAMILLQEADFHPVKNITPGKCEKQILDFNTRGPGVGEAGTRLLYINHHVKAIIGITPPFGQ